MPQARGCVNIPPAMTPEPTTLMKELGDQKYALDQAAIVAATDRRGVITYVNDKFCEISEYSRGDLLGKTHAIVNSGFHGKDFFAELWKTVSSGQVWKGEVCNRKKSGALYWVATTIVPFLDESGKPYQYLSIRQDITALKQAQETIVEQQAKLVAHSRLMALGELAACLTHEINNPLGVILGRCEMLRMSIDRGAVSPAELLKVAETIEVTGHRIEKVVRNMRSLARGEDSENIEEVAVASVIDNACDLTQQRFVDHGIRFELSLDYVGTVPCRPTQVLQILVNLLNNAHDAVHVLPKGLDRWVRLSVKVNNSWIEFAVEDSGSGIAQDLVPRLFTPFFTTKDVQMGTGLGLSIARGLAQRQNGDLILASPAKPTRFVLRLPLHK